MIGDCLKKVWVYNCVLLKNFNYIDIIIYNVINVILLFRIKVIMIDKIIISVYNYYF